MHRLIHKAHHSVHRHLKLQHHRHTGRRLHHKHTSYRALAVVLVLAGAVMIAITMVQRAAANSLFGVSAMVPGPVPATSAIITTPAADATLTSKSALIAGSCPISQPPLTVVLIMDGTAAGSAYCDSNNNFALPVTLSPGMHSLVAQTYNSTLGQGPDSTLMQITYKQSGTSPAAATVALSAGEPFTILQADLSATWAGSITGGTPPYKVLVDWGDGHVDSHTVAQADQQFTHRYAALQSYNARVAVTDAVGASAQQQYAATAYEAVLVPVATLTQPSGPGGPFVAGLYGLFLTVTCVSAIIWLEAKHAARQEVVVAV